MADLKTVAEKSKSFVLAILCFGTGIFTLMMGRPLLTPIITVLDNPIDQGIWWGAYYVFIFLMLFVLPAVLVMKSEA